jgi:hypothetical protein
VAVIGSLFAMVGRFAGRLLNSALGWATMLLFGKVEGRKQTLLLLIALGSLLWVVVLVGIAVPDVGTLLLAFVPVPDFVDESLVRVAMLGATLAIPLLIGIGAIFVTEPASRPRGSGLLASVLRGYPFTLVLALTIGLLAAVSIVRKALSLARRWDDAHVPVIVKPGGYDRVLGDLESVLTDAGLAVHQRPAPGVLSLPPRLLDKVAGKGLGALVPDRLMLLRGPDIEILVYPSDIAISGRKGALARGRAAIAAKLTASPAYLTTSAESERVEDAIRELVDDARRNPTRVERQLAELDQRIARLEVPFDEWETVYRERLQVEAQLRSNRREGSLTEPQVAREDTEPLLVRIAGWMGLALIAIDVLLLLAERIVPPRNER